jgi:hypothetical protein
VKAAALCNVTLGRVQTSIYWFGMHWPEVTDHLCLHFVRMCLGLTALIYIIFCVVHTCIHTCIHTYIRTHMHVHAQASPAVARLKQRRSACSTSRRWLGPSSVSRSSCWRPMQCSKVTAMPKPHGTTTPVGSASGSQCTWTRSAGWLGDTSPTSCWRSLACPFRFVILKQHTCKFCDRVNE